MSRCERPLPASGERCRPSVAPDYRRTDRPCKRNSSSPNVTFGQEDIFVGRHGLIALTRRLSKRHCIPAGTGTNRRSASSRAGYMLALAATLVAAVADRRGARVVAVGQIVHLLRSGARPRARPAARRRLGALLESAIARCFAGISDSVGALRIRDSPAGRPLWAAGVDGAAGAQP